MNVLVYGREGNIDSVYRDVLYLVARNRWIHRRRLFTGDWWNGWWKTHRVRNLRRFERENEEQQISEKSSLRESMSVVVAEHGEVEGSSAD